jgi:CHAT domain-containing protein
VSLALAAASTWHEARADSGRDWPCGALARARLPAPLAGALACPEEPADAQPTTAEWLALAALERRAASTTASTVELRAGAAARLVARDHASARALLERARAKAPDDAATLNDLAVLQLSAFEADGELVAALLALEFASQASKAAPALLEAEVTLASVHERLGLAVRARERWQRLALTLPAGRWRVYAAERARSLSQPGLFERWQPESGRLDAAAPLGDLATVDAVARGYPHGARRWVEKHALPAWSSAVSKRDNAAATAWLAAAERVAAVVAERLDDDLLARSIATMRGALEARDGAALVALADGLRLYDEAMQALDHERHRDAIQLLARSAELLRASGSPWALSADFWRACALESDGQLDAATQALQALSAPLAGLRAPYLAALRDHEQAALASRRGQHFQALHGYRRALPTFERAQVLGNMGQVHAHLYEILHTLGDSAGAARELRAALDLLPDLHLWPRRVDILAAATRFALAVDAHAGARLFDDELLAAARELGDGVAEAEGLLLRAALDARVEARRDVARHLDEARRTIDALPPTHGLRARLLGEWHAAAAELHAGQRGADAAGFLQGAFDYFNKVGQRGRLARLHTLRARAALAGGQRHAARADLEQALDHLEQSGDEIESVTWQAAWSAQARETYDALAGLRVDAGQADAALDMVERGRARGLLRAAERPDVRPLSERELRAALPPGVELIEYALLGERLLAWHVTARGTRLVRLATRAGEREALQARVEHVADALAQHVAGNELLADLSALHAALLEPVLERGRTTRATLVVVPDGFLHRVPFAALRDSEGHFVVQEQAVVLAPSASLYVLRRAADCRRPTGAWRAAVAGQAEVDARAFPDLARLTRAEAEARAVAALYPGSALLLGAQATREALLLAAREADVLHVAAHARASSLRPADSALLLAATPNDSGLLTLRDLEQPPGLPRTRVAVLSACSTARGPISRGEGMLGLARAFQAASVSAVVATAWDVEDRATQDVMQSLHRGLARGLRVSEALRSAQVQALSSADARRAAPTAWAAFTAFGDTCGVRAAVMPR